MFTCCESFSHFTFSKYHFSFRPRLQSMKVIVFQMLIIIVMPDFIMAPIQIIEAWTKQLPINRIWLVQTTRRFQKTTCFWGWNYRRGRIWRGCCFEYLDQILLETLSKFLFPLMFSGVKANFPNQYQWSFSISPDDIRFSDVFRGYRKRPVTRNGLIWWNFK